MSMFDNAETEVISLIIRNVDGLVVNAAVGTPTPADGEAVVAREGAAADAWIGWVRQPDGTFLSPEPPEDEAES